MDFTRRKGLTIPVGICILIITIANLSSGRNNILTVVAPNAAVEVSPSSLNRRCSYPRKALGRTSSKFSPISCQEIFEYNRNLHQNVTDPNGGRLYARYTLTKPPFWISLHDEGFDGTRWGIMKYGTYYESVLSRMFVQTINATLSNEIHVIDVGGNIGWYSLLSIATAVQVNKSIVVNMFEPNPRNRLRMCESLQLNNWLEHDSVSVNVYPVGISSKTGGSVKMGISESGTGTLGVYNENNQTETISIPLVSLDDLADELGWDGATILKVDVEGLELEVFEGATRFLNTSRVQNIFFEGNKRTLVEQFRFPQLVRLLVDVGYYLFKFGAWKGPRETLPKRLVDQFRNQALDEAIMFNVTMTLLNRRCKDQCNLWWQPLRTMTNNIAVSEATMVTP